MSGEQGKAKKPLYFFASTHRIMEASKKTTNSRPVRFGENPQPVVVGTKKRANPAPWALS
jgi:hypothetical protein